MWHASATVFGNGSFSLMMSFFMSSINLLYLYLSDPSITYNFLLSFIYHKVVTHSWTKFTKNVDQWSLESIITLSQSCVIGVCTNAFGISKVIISRCSVSITPVMRIASVAAVGLNALAWCIRVVCFHLQKFGPWLLDLSFLKERWDF